MKQCRFYVDEKSCFECPMPDCTWTANGALQEIPADRHEYICKKLDEAKAEQKKARTWNSKENKRKQVKYWQKKLDEMESNQEGGQII